MQGEAILWYYRYRFLGIGTKSNEFRLIRELVGVLGTGSFRSRRQLCLVGGVLLCQEEEDLVRICREWGVGG